MIVYRGSRDELVIEVRSDEELGILDTGFLEDYYGVDGQVSLHHLATSTRYGVLMVEDPSATPGVSHDFFTGITALEFLPDGDYRIEGLVRDVLGHYTVLSDHHTLSEGFGPDPDVPVSIHEFSIVLGQAQPPRQSELASYHARRTMITSPTPAMIEVMAKSHMITNPTPAFLSVQERAFIRPIGKES